MRKCDVIDLINKTINDLEKERKHFKSLDTYNSGAIYHLRDLKFKIEKMGTKQEKMK